jgi:uncharacterized protein
MRSDLVIEKLRQAEPSLRALGVRGAALFGSTARGEGGEYSDIDIAVQPEGDAPILPLTLISIHGVLADALGHGSPIDVVVLPAREPALNEAIQRDGLRAF